MRRRFSTPAVKSCEPSGRSKAGPARGRGGTGISSVGGVLPDRYRQPPDGPSRLLASLRRGLVARHSRLRNAATSAMPPSVAGRQCRRLGKTTPALLKLTPADGRPRADPISQRAALVRLHSRFATPWGSARRSQLRRHTPLTPTASATWSRPLLVRGSTGRERDRMPRAVLDDLERTGATVFPGMPVSTGLFANGKPTALSRLRLCFAGAAARWRSPRNSGRKIPTAIHPFTVVGVRGIVTTAKRSWKNQASCTGRCRE